MSMTKPVTAIAIMMLAEEGKLALRDPVEQYLPEFQNQRVAANAGPDAAKARRARACHHDPRPAHPHRRVYRTRSRRDPGLSALDERASERGGAPARKERLLFQPGTRGAISSAGIEILGRIIEVCSGQKYEDFIAARILRPSV